MPITGTRITVTTAATLLARATNAPTLVTIKNADATNAIDLGGATVTTGTGFALAAGIIAAPFQLLPGDELYAVAASGTVVAQVLIRT